MASPSILILGDSHIYALRAALSGGAAGTARIEAARLQAKKAGTVIGDLSMEEAEARAQALGPDDLLALVIRGNQYNSVGLMRHPQPFDVVLPGDIEAPTPGAELVPYHAFREYFETTLLAGYGKLYARLARASGAPVACLEVPPPKEDEAHILRGAEAAFRDGGIADIGVSPARTRLRLWRLQQEALARRCAEIGIRYLPSPPEAVDAGGFLAPRFYAKDATHANAAYGALVIRQLVALAGAQAQEATA